MISTEALQSFILSAVLQKSCGLACYILGEVRRMQQDYRAWSEEQRFFLSGLLFHVLVNMASPLC